MKMTQRLLAIAGAAACVAPAFAQELYNNGTANGGTPPYGLATGPHSTGVLPPAGYGFSELQADPVNPAQTNNTFGFGAQFAVSTNRIADDFTVTGGGWNVTTVSVYGYLTGSATTASPVDGASLEIWNGRPGDATSTVVFGDTTTNRFASAQQTFLLRVARAGPTFNRAIWKAEITVNTQLAPGTYWISYQASSSTLGGFCPPMVKPGVLGPPNANARQFTTAWADLEDATSLALPVGSGIKQEASFSINGTQIGGGGCYANCDASTLAPCLNVNDFLCFNNLYAAGSSSANCDQSTLTPILNVNDFLCFNNRYAAGCTNPCAAP
jgi:hypothetical protein